MLGKALKQGFCGLTEALKGADFEDSGIGGGLDWMVQTVVHLPTPPQVLLPIGTRQRDTAKNSGALTLGLHPILQVPSECSSHSASCSPEWGSALEFGPNPGGK